MPPAAEPPGVSVHGEAWWAIVTRGTAACNPKADVSEPWGLLRKDPVYDGFFGDGFQGWSNRGTG